MAGPTAVDKYIGALQEPHRSTLTSLRSALVAALPFAEESMKYGMPAVLVGGKAVAGYQACKKHCSLYPHSGSVLMRIDGPLPKGISVPSGHSGALHFPADASVPDKLLHKVLHLRLEELESRVRTGKALSVRVDGSVAASGRKQDGLRHGKWTFFLPDGVIERTVQYKHGAETVDTRASETAETSRKRRSERQQSPTRAIAAQNKRYRDHARAPASTS
jgi:uncharacterized protein YdhG (YjbR/CyaY superfamily)